MWGKGYGGYEVYMEDMVCGEVMVWGYRVGYGVCVCGILAFAGMCMWRPEDNLLMLLVRDHPSILLMLLVKGPSTF